MPENKNQAAEQEEVLEETAAEASTESVEASEADQLKEQLTALNEKYVRMLAEYDNFRKRSQKEKDAIRNGVTIVLTDNIRTIK